MTVTPTYVTRNKSELWLIKAGFDDLLLTGVNVDSSGSEFRIKSLDEGASWSKAAPIDVAVQRWMADGAIASTQGYENRDITFRVVINAPTSTELAAGEAALSKRAGLCLLKWIPAQGAGIASATVFEIWTWNFGQDFSIDRENALSRAYTIEATAKPWARSELLTTIAAPAIPGSPTIVSVDTCASTTGWVGSPNPVSVVGGTKVNESSPTYGSGGTHTISLTRTGAVTGMGTTPYLMLDITALGGSSQSIVVTIDGTVITKIGQVGTVSYYQVPVGVSSFTVLAISFTATLTPGFAMTLQCADVSRTDTIGGLVGTKQLIRSLVPGGSVKTSGSIKIASPSATALGTCLVYTFPDTGSGYTPPLRQFRTTGNTVTADGAAVSGSHEALVAAGVSAGFITYNLPAQFIREATYLLIGRFFSTAATTISVQVNASSTGGSVLDSFTTPVTLAASGGSWAVLGAFTLPTQALPPESQVIQILSLNGSGGTGTQTLDDVYLLDVTHGAVSLITGGSSTILWLDAPDADQIRNRPAVYLGTLADRTDALGAAYSKILALGDHDLYPDGTGIYTITDNVASAAATVALYRRWHTNAGS